MAERSNEEVLQQYWKATTTGDIPLLRPLIAEDAVFHYPGQHYISGTYHGVEEVCGLYKTVTGLGTQLFEGKLRDVVTTGDGKYSVVILSYKLKLPLGKFLPGRAVGLMRIWGGQIHEYWLFEWDQHMINDVWWTSAPQVFIKQKNYVKIVVKLPRILLALTRTLIRVMSGYQAPTEPN